MAIRESAFTDTGDAVWNRDNSQVADIFEGIFSDDGYRFALNKAWNDKFASYRLVTSIDCD